MSAANGNGTSGTLPFDEAMCERYLFGELSEAEQERFESAYFSDDSFFNRFLAVKDELLDLYSRNELEPEKRRRLGHHFRSTEPRRNRLAEADEFISSITQLAERSAEPVRPPIDGRAKREGFFETLRGAFALPTLATAAGIVVVAALGFWMFGWRQAPERSAELNDRTIPDDAVKRSTNSTGSGAEMAGEPGPLLPEGDRSRPRTDRSEHPQVAVDPSRSVTVDDSIPGPSPSPTPPRSEVVQNDPAPPRPVPSVKPPEPKQEIDGVTTEFVTLDSASRSITRRNTASIGPATQNVALRMIFGGEPFANYSVRVTTIGGSTVWQASGLRAGMNEGPKSLTVTVPARSLSRKDYIVVLAGGSGEGKYETIREYYLHVDRQ